MITPADMEAKTARLETLLAEKYRLTKGDLQTRIHRLGRGVPAAVRKDLLRVAEAAFVAGNPKLARLQDPAAIRRAFDRAVAHLETIDPADRRKGKLVSLAADILGKLLIIVALLIGVLVWRGYA